MRRMPGARGICTRHSPPREERFKMSRVSKRAGTKALVCQQCVRETAKGKTNARNVGSFRGRPSAYLRHTENGHGRTLRPAEV
jgi:hypothetical protein